MKRQNGRALNNGFCSKHNGRDERESRIRKKQKPCLRLQMRKIDEEDLRQDDLW